MKLIIAGGRDYRLGKAQWKFLDGIDIRHQVDQVVSGDCRGADREGEAWADDMGIPVRHFLANWPEHGKAAGPIRNQAMADYADALALFPGGRGSADMRRKAEAGGLKVFVYGEGE